MLFKKYTVYENKLSEQLSDDNPLKQKLINMETPTDHHPVYSFLSIGLLIYIWVFLMIILYEKSYGYKWNIFPVILATFCFRNGYKRNNILCLDHRSNITNNIILYSAFFYSMLMVIYDPRANIPSEEIKNFFIFFTNNGLKKFNYNTYVCLNILSYTTIGVILSYCNCTYFLYRSFYSFKKDNPNSHLYRNYLIFSSIFPFLIYLIICGNNNSGPFNTGITEDWFKIIIRNSSPLIFILFPVMIFTMMRSSYYLILYKIATFSK